MMDEEVQAQAFLSTWRAEGYAKFLETMERLEKVQGNYLSLADLARRRDYHVTDFWRRIPIEPCDILEGKVVRQAFKDLCRLLSLSSRPYKTLNLASVLATQLRSPKNHQSLLVDQEKFRLTFHMRNPSSIEKFLMTADDEDVAESGYFRDFLSSIDEMDDEEVMVFGPAFASAIVTLKKCSARTVADKIFFMKSNLKKCYPLLSELKVRLPAKEVLIDILGKSKEAHLNDSNTVVLGCMYAYYKQDLTVEMKDMLDTLVLKSFRYSSMQLLTFVDEVTKAYVCSVDEYRQLTEGYKRSWETYDRFMAEYGPKESAKGEPDDSFWMYAREFDHGVFAEVTYNNNVRLCNFSADLLDLKLRSHKVQPWPVLGPTYQNLTRYKRSKSRAKYCEEDHKYALEVHDILNLQRQ